MESHSSLYVYQVGCFEVKASLVFRGQVSLLVIIRLNSLPTEKRNFEAQSQRRHRHKTRQKVASQKSKEAWYILYPKPIPAACSRCPPRTRPSGPIHLSTTP